MADRRGLDFAKRHILPTARLPKLEFPAVDPLDYEPTCVDSELDATPDMDPSEVLDRQIERARVDSRWRRSCWSSISCPI
jgi:hypothetical protein